MTVGTPAWLAASGGLPAYDATELRVIDTMLATYDGNVLGAREGTRPGGSPLAVTLTGSPLNWNVAPGIASVSGIASGVLGVYVVPVTVTETGLVAAADVTFPRKDIIVLQVKDAENGDATREALISYITGVATATPSAPAVPAKAILLGTVDVPKAGTGSPSVVVNTKYTVASGGVLPTASRPTATYPGLTIYNLSTGTMEYHDGTTWVALSGSSPDIQVFAASGTWTKPANAKYVDIELVGGGGGSGGVATTGAGQAACSPGGGGGGYARKSMPASSVSTTVTVTVGAGGTAGTAGANSGGNGGTSSFGAYCSATGGSLSAGGTASTAAGLLGTGGAGGVGSGGDINIQGSRGWTGLGFSGSVHRAPGGSSQLGGNEPGGASSTGLAGAVGKSYGGGAQGAANAASQATARAGGAGGPGVVIVRTYF